MQHAATEAGPPPAEVGGPPFVLLLLSGNRHQSPAALGGSLHGCMCRSKPAVVQRPQRVPVPAAMDGGSCSLSPLIASKSGKRRQASRTEHNLLQVFKEFAQAPSSLASGCPPQSSCVHLITNCR